MSLQYAVLGILTYSPMSGYDLGKIFNKSVNYTWTASLSQIYRELAALEKKEYVSSNIQQQDDRPDKKMYCITEEGRLAFLGWLNDFPETFSSPKRDEFTLRIFFASKVDDDELIKQFERFIAERRNFNAAMEEGEKNFMEMARSFKQGAAAAMQEHKRYWHFIVKRALMTNEVLITWAEECIRELKAEALQGGKKDEA